MKLLSFIVFLFFTNLLFAANFTVLDFMALDGAEQSLVSGTYDTFVNNFKPAGFTQIHKFKVRKTAQDMGIQLSTATPPQMKPVMDKLKVTHIVLGKVRKINNEYVVTVSFIKAGTDSPLATEETHFSASHVEPVKALAQNLAKKLRGGKGGSSKTQATAPAPVPNEAGIIYGYLKVFPKDLGPFPNDPEDIINNINAAQQFGYNTWRIPTENELSLLVTEGYIKNPQGYMSDANNSGKLRLVTDKKTAKELAEEAAAEEARREEERKAEEARKEAERKAEEERLKNLLKDLPGKSIQFGKYSGEQIEWKVLAVDSSDNTALIISRYGLEARRFDNESNVWNDSDVRRWLNNTFYETFTSDEQSSIVALQDGSRVFLLTKEDVERFFPNACDRIAYPTSQARESGAWLSSSDGCGGASSGAGAWLLRSQGPESGKALYVGSGGGISDGPVSDTDYIVRPAMWIKIK